VYVHGVFDRPCRINLGYVFDFTTDLNGFSQAYAVMHERRAIKSLVKVGTI
jgi:hypothetical protein